nr:hypothetical protein [Solidesulfovibrio sp.]
MRRPSLSVIGLVLCCLALAAPAMATQPAPRPTYAAEAIPDPAPSPPVPPHQAPAGPDAGDAVRRQVSDERVF